MLERLEEVHLILPSLVLVGALLLAAVLAHFVVRRALIAFIHLLASRGSLQWDEALQRHRVFHRITHVIPAIVVYRGIWLVNGADNRLITDAVVSAVQNITLAYVALMVTLAITAALGAGNDIYERQPIARDRPLKGIVQVLQIAVYLVGAVIIVPHPLDRSPLVLLSGFGAMTAILLLVYKHTIL
jgi:miniconductance mechanosensitive channel